MPVRVTYAGQDYQLVAGESVLDGLTRQGAGIAAACRAGVCHSCLLRAREGHPGPSAQRGLKPTLAARGYFLACQARPNGDLTLAGPGDDMITPARVAARRWLSAQVLAVWLRPDRPLSFLPGQHVTLHRSETIARPYSVVNLPGQAARDGLAFHVRVYPRGVMSDWLATARLGTGIGLGVPAGACCYVPGDPAAPLLLGGTGTGMAPLLGIARDALAHGHHGPIVMVHGAADPSRLYLGEPPRPWADEEPWPPSVRWRTCARSRGEDIAAVLTGELASLGDPTSAHAFLCGGQRQVTAMRRALFLAGMSARHINADAFLPAR